MSEIKAMRRVSAYRTSDDKLHDTRPEAVRHQARIDLCQIVEDESFASRMAAEEFVDSVLPQADHIIKLLRAATKEV
jgi:hypothetical protein